MSPVDSWTGRASAWRGSLNEAVGGLGARMHSSSNQRLSEKNQDPIQPANPLAVASPQLQSHPPCGTRASPSSGRPAASSAGRMQAVSWPP